jgi:hypothetical protein
MRAVGWIYEARVAGRVGGEEGEGSLRETAEWSRGISGTEQEMQLEIALWRLVRSTE